MKNKTLRNILIGVCAGLLLGGGIVLGATWSDYDELASGTIADGDDVLVRDVSDTTFAVTGTQHRYAWSSIKASLAAAGFYDAAADESDPNVDSVAEIMAIIDNEALDFGTGVLTTAGFVGPVTGAVTGNADTVTNGIYTTDDGYSVGNESSQVITHNTGSGTDPTETWTDTEVTIDVPVYATSFVADASATPGFLAKDSGAPGADKEVGKIYWDYVDGADGAENADVFFQAMQDGSEVTFMQYDESDDQVEISKKVDTGANYVYAPTYIELPITAWTTDNATGDGKFYYHVPPHLTGMNLVYTHAEVITAGTATAAELLTIQVYNVTDTVDMLSTAITLDSTETGSDEAAAAAVIDAANDDIAENDLLRIDIDTIFATTASKGMLVTLGFAKP